MKFMKRNKKVFATIIAVIIVLAMILGAVAPFFI